MYRSWDSWEDWKADIIAEAELEALSNDPVHRRFILHYFVSSSKGKGRKRKHLEEVELVKDRFNDKGFIGFNRFPFDDVASEVYPKLSGLDAEARLQEHIRSRAKR